MVDAEEIPYPDASFDLVTCRIAPHHFPDPAAFVRESARVLRSGGRFVLVDSTVPDGDAGVFFNRFETLRDPSHVRSLTVDEWQGLIAAAGTRPDACRDVPQASRLRRLDGRSRMDLATTGTGWSG